MAHKLPVPQPDFRFYQQKTTDYNSNQRFNVKRVITVLIQFGKAEKLKTPLVQEICFKFRQQ